MQTGIDKIKDWYDRQGQAVWWLYNGNLKEETKPRDRYPVDSTVEITPEESRARLIDVLESLEPGVYTLVTQKSFAATNSKTQDTFKIVREENTGNGPARIGSTAEFFDRLKEERAAALEQAREDFARQLEIHDLQRDNRELKEKLRELEQDNKELGRKANEIEERKVSYIGQAVSAFSNIIAPNLTQPAPAANIGTVEGAQDQNSDEERLRRVVGIFRAAEPEQWLDLLEGVAYIVQNEPNTYKMVKPMILRK